VIVSFHALPRCQDSTHLNDEETKIVTLFVIKNTEPQY